MPRRPGCAARPDPDRPLTPRQLQVAALLVSGHGRRQTARLSGVSENRVDAIVQALAARDAADLRRARLPDATPPRRLRSFGYRGGFAPGTPANGGLLARLERVLDRHFARHGRPAPVLAPLPAPADAGEG